MKDQDRRSKRNQKQPLPLWRKVLSIVFFAVALMLFAFAGYQWLDAQEAYEVQEVTNQKLAVYAEEVPEEAEPSIDWEGLKAVNDDIRGWLKIPGTPVDYPVYQGENNDTYLRTNAFGEYSVGGQLFMDCANSGADLFDQQTIIYGHHLQDGSMFGAIADFDRQDFFDSITSVWWTTELGAYEFVPVMCYRVQPDDTTVRQFTWFDEASFHDYLAQKLALSVTHHAMAVPMIDSTQHVLTLVTCNYINGKGRTVIVCVPKSEVGAVMAQDADAAREVV